MKQRAGTTAAQSVRKRRIQKFKEDVRPNVWAWRLSASGLALAAGLAFIPALWNAYSFDDVYIVARNTQLRSVARWLYFLSQDYWAPFGTQGLYRPLTIWSFSAGWLLTPDQPAWYHATNLALHGAVAALVYSLACKLSSQRAAVIAALWFGLQPMHTEVVAGLVGRSDLLSAVLLLATLLVLARLDLSTTPRWKIVGVGVLSLAALGAKESAIVVLPLALLWLAFLPSTDAERWKPGEKRGSPPRVRAWSFGRLAPLFSPGIIAIAFATLVYLVMRWRVVGLLAKAPFADNPLGPADFATRLRTATLITSQGVWALVWPFRLSPDYSFNQIPVVARWGDPRWIIAALMLLFIVSAVFTLRRHRPVVFGAAWTAIAYLPVSNLVFPIGTLRAERLWYLPSVGTAVIFGSVSDVLWKYAEARAAQSPGWLRCWIRHGIPALLALGLSVFVLTDLHECRYWRDNLALFTMGVERAPRSARMHQSLGAELAQRHEDDAAIREFRTALAIYPEDGEAEAQLGRALEDDGQLTPAIDHQRRALALDPSEENFLFLSGTLLKAKRYEEILTASRAVREPLDARAQIAVGLAYLGLRQPEQAAAELAQAVASDPGNARAHLFHAAALHALGREAEAAQEVVIADRLNRDIGEAASD